MKKKQIFRSGSLILVMVLSIISSFITDSKLTMTAYASGSYNLTAAWDEGIEWVATDEAGTDKWTNGRSKSFTSDTTAYTYIKLKPGYRLDCLTESTDKEWSDYIAISDTVYYTVWGMYKDRAFTVNTIADVFEEDGVRYTYNGNYTETGYKLIKGTICK